VHADSTDPALSAADVSHIADVAEGTAVLLAATLALVKGITFALTGSIAILASAADSLMDVAASSVNWLAVRKAAEPPDAEHSYGHGKFEAAAGVFQAGVVATAATYLSYTAIRRFWTHEQLDHLTLGIGVMAVSTAVSVLIVIILRSAARKSGSVAVAGDALHYTTDVLTNLATVAALVLVRFTGEHLWDPLIALGLTAYLLKAAMDIFNPAWKILVDHALTDSERLLVELSLQSCAPPEVVGYYNLRTRTSGRKHFADVRVVFRADVPFARIHDITEQLEADVVARFRNAEVVIHPEPLGAHDITPADLTWSRDASGAD